MDAKTQTVLFKAAPLLTVTALPLAVVGLALASFLRRDRGRATKQDKPIGREPMGILLIQISLSFRSPVPSGPG